jgi:glycosyltransferase involved in cell wall biosynthesis
MKPCTITVLTATLNAEDNLPALIESLRKQTDKQFKWLVVDGDSTDSTIEILRSVNDLDILLVTGRDYGIYDALNKAIPLINTDYYVIAGADDTLSPDAIANFRQAANNTNADIISAAVDMGSHICKPNNWLYQPTVNCSGMSNHSIGTLIKTSLHDTCGLYDLRFAVASDIAFLLNVRRAKCTFYAINSIAGHFSGQGFSNRHYLQGVFETTLARIEAGKPILTEILVLLLRVIKNYRRINAMRFIKPHNIHKTN